jgi:hypothetical protein
VRSWKESGRVKDTHFLEIASGGTDENTEREQARCTHILERSEGGTIEDMKVSK